MESVGIALGILFGLWLVDFGVWILLYCVNSFCGPGVLWILSIVLWLSLSVLYCSVENGPKKEV